MAVSQLTPRVEKLEQKTADHATRLDCHDQSLGDHQRSIDKHTMVLFGVEGQPGLVKSVMDIQTILDTFATYQAKQQIFNGILTFIGVTLGASVIAFIWAIITHSVQIVR